jgi:hypothetical protein
LNPLSSKKSQSSSSDWPPSGRAVIANTPEAVSLRDDSARARQAILDFQFQFQNEFFFLRLSAFRGAPCPPPSPRKSLDNVITFHGMKDTIDGCNGPCNYDYKSDVDASYDSDSSMSSSDSSWSGTLNCLGDNQRDCAGIWGLTLNYHLCADWSQSSQLLGMVFGLYSKLRW